MIYLLISSSVLFINKFRCIFVYNFVRFIMEVKYIVDKKNPTHLGWILKFVLINCLFMAPIHNAYLDNGINIRLTVDIFIIPFILSSVKVYLEIQI